MWPIALKFLCYALKTPRNFATRASEFHNRIALKGSWSLKIILLNVFNCPADRLISIGRCIVRVLSFYVVGGELISGILSQTRQDVNKCTHGRE